MYRRLLYAVNKKDKLYCHVGIELPFTIMTLKANYDICLGV